MSYIIPNASVFTAKIRDQAVTTDKIADGNVTNPKLGVLSVATGNIQASAVTTAKIATQNVTQDKLALRSTGTTIVGLGGVGITNSSGNFQASSLTAVTNLTVQITTAGRPVMIFLIPDGSGNGYIGASNASNGERVYGGFAIVRSSTNIANYEVGWDGEASGANNSLIWVPCSSLSFLDTPAAGTYTYQIQAETLVGGGLAVVNASKLVVYEI